MYFCALVTTLLLIGTATALGVNFVERFHVLLTEYFRCLVIIAILSAVLTYCTLFDAVSTYSTNICSPSSTGCLALFLGHIFKITNTY